MANPKTNAIRILEREKIPCTLHSYDAGDGHIDGRSVAQKTGQDPARVYKTLVTRGHSGGHYVFVLPVEGELDLKKAARVVGEKSVEMLPVADLLKTTGYVRGGCSPIGMKKPFPTVFHQEAAQQPYILVSAGKIGLQIQASAQDLARACGGQFADLLAE